MKNEERLFFDSHMHAFNLCHPNFGTFILRLISLKAILIIPFIIFTCFIVILVLGHFNFHLVITSFVILGILLIGFIFIISKLRRIIKLINLMDMKTSQYFYTIEDEYKKFFQHGKKIKISSNAYDKVAICPLAMHFRSYKSLEDVNRVYKWILRLNYDLAIKSIQEQSVDLFIGIRDYYTKPRDEKEQNNKHKPKGKETPKEIMDPKNRLLKIYPFMGLTVNKENYNTDHPLNEVLDKYFGNLPMENRKKEFDEKLATGFCDFKGDIDTLRDLTFVGIKIYPPLGFDPWPESEEQRKDVKQLYKRCVDKNIPIIVHCGGHGFRTVNKTNYKKYSDPEQWNTILKEYPMLKICFAHFGPSINPFFVGKRTQQIIDMMTNTTFGNVYTDISCRCFKASHFKRLNKMIIKEAKRKNVNEKDIYEKVLYGTDFPMNQLKSNSYGAYIQVLSKYDSEGSLTKKLCEENPIRFLFGECLTLEGAKEVSIHKDIPIETKVDDLLMQYRFE